MDQMYQLLMGLPLFSGVTYEKMLEIIGSTKFHFLKYLEGETFISEGEQCTHIKFIISGKVRVSIANADRRFTVSQTLTAPDVVAPEYISDVRLLIHARLWHLSRPAFCRFRRSII